MIKAHGIRTVIVVSWLISTAALLRYEAYPAWFTRSIPGYRGVIEDTLLARESWMRILVNDQPAGYSHTVLGIDDESPEQLLEIENRTHMRVALAGQPRRLYARSLIALDRDTELVSFETSISMGELTASVAGQRITGRNYAIRINMGGVTSEREVEIADDVVLFSPLQELTLRRLRPGRRVTLKTLNPLTLQSLPVIVEGMAYETIEVGGRSYQALRLRSSWEGMAFDSWVDEEGAILRQHTLPGWVFEASTAEEALAAVDTGETPPALFGAGGGFLINFLTGRTF